MRPPSTILADLGKHLNFFRYHLLFFTFTPLVFSGLFYAANGSAGGNANDGSVLGRQRVEYIDALFLCFSAMTVTGLVTVNVSALHPFQQALLFILFILGDVSVVSLFMVLVRKRFFRNHCEQLLRNDHFRRTNTVLPDRTSLLTRTRSLLPTRTTPTVDGEKKRWKGGMVRISGPKDVRAARTSMAERQEAIVDSPTSMEHHTGPSGETTAVGSETPTLDRGDEEVLCVDSSGVVVVPDERERAVQIAEPSLSAYSTATSSAAPYVTRQRIRAHTRRMSTLPLPTTLTSDRRRRSSTSSRRSEAHIPRHDTHHLPTPSEPQHTGMGGFPSVVQLLDAVLPPRLKTYASRPAHHRTLSIAVHPDHPTAPATSHKRHDDEEVLGGGEARRESEENWKTVAARWMPDSLAGLVVGRNSRFYSEELEDNELEQLGGVEYRALRLLSYVVGFYIFLCQTVPFAILAIYFAATSQWNGIFQPSIGVQASIVDKTWYSLFQSVAAYTGAGMSLVDQSMAPFQHCYLMIYVLCIVMLVGNHALPMVLRLIIWLATKIWRKGTVNETLHFLLDHPRRCFLYLFPSHQTWYLLLALVGFILVELFGFLVLNIDLPVLSGLSGLDLFSDGFLQSLSVRASGFGIVAIANMAPSVLFLYVILMYVAIYPIAMSVRSTNVYEERALGVYESEDPETASDSEPTFQGKRHEVFSKYLMWHMRRQLAFDIWPLALAIFVVACFERGKLLNPASSQWFTLFRIIFECTSAYSTIGLSLGTPNGNYSFVGEFGTASKLVMIAVMLRGRHRGLPVAIDRAILLPREYARIDKKAEAEQLERVQTVGSARRSGDVGEGASSLAAAQDPSTLRKAQ